MPLPAISLFPSFGRLYLSEPVVARKHFRRNHAAVRVALSEDTFSDLAERRMMLRVNAGGATRSKEYAERLTRLQTTWWKSWLDVQAPFRWNLRRLQPGFTLDLGCGIGRNLEHFPGTASESIRTKLRESRASARFQAFTPDEFRRAPEYNRPGRFDTMLLAHVAEHMTEAEALSLLQEYESLVRPGGKSILIAPQEAGFRSDATHVELMDFERLTRISDRLGFRPDRIFSFPFPRWVGGYSRTTSSWSWARRYLPRCESGARHRDTARLRDRRQPERRRDAPRCARLPLRPDVARARGHPGGQRLQRRVGRPGRPVLRRSADGHSQPEERGIRARQQHRFRGGSRRLDLPPESRRGVRSRCHRTAHAVRRSQGRRRTAGLPRRPSDQPNFFDSVGLLLYPDGVSRPRGWQEKDQGQYDRAEEVLAPHGCACALRKAMLDQIGGFDEDFFCYFEDLDLGVRGQLAGWKCWYVPGGARASREIGDGRQLLGVQGVSRRAQPAVLPVEVDAALSRVRRTALHAQPLRDAGLRRHDAPGLVRGLREGIFRWRVWSCC